ncbi:MAG: alpha-L-fucosidase [Planctomycetia bacterium]|nr:alpha-L-fucosidase [Planctomycetia bacterium]
MANWFGDCFRKVHVLFVAPEWAPVRAEKFDAKQYIKALKEAGVGVIEFYIKDHHGISYNKTAVGNPHGIDLLKPLVDEAHAAGIKFIAYYSIGWDKWAWENHPDWRVADSKQQGIMNPVTTNSGYGDFALTQLEEIARDAEIDGIFLDIYVKDYGNDAEYLKKICDVVKKHRPEAMITFNGAGGADDDLNQWADFSSMEAHGWHYQYQSWVARALKREGKPVEIETPGHTLGWAGWSPKPAAELMVEATAIAASGGSATIGLNPYPDGSILQAEIENMGKVWHWLESIE